jgi:DNA-binding MarR family transcriptional regulator
MSLVPHPEADAPLLRLLGLSLRQLSNDLNDKLIDAGFTDHRDSFHNVMPHIPADGIRLTELARRAGVSKQAMAELVGEAERLHYLQRSPDPSDGRAKIITFTDKGRAAVGSALASLTEIERELTDRLGEPSVRRLRKLLLDVLNRPAYTRRDDPGK